MRRLWTRRLARALGRRSWAGVMAGIGGVLCLAIWTWAVFSGTGSPGQPRDRALPQTAGAAEMPDGLLRITVLGTSLTALYDWPARLEAALAACLDQPVRITVIARPGATIAWGADQVAMVAASAPNLVLVEFAINDADLRGGLSPAAAAQRHRDLVVGLRAAIAPAPRIVLMTMNPARGPRGWMRPRLAAHYAGYVDLARTADLGLVDLYSRWLALPVEARGLERDGLHPAPRVAARIILPVLVPYLAQTWRGGCHPVLGRID